MLKLTNNMFWRLFMLQSENKSYYIVCILQEYAEL